MLRRVLGYLLPREEAAPAASAALEARGCVVLRGVLDADEVRALAADVERVFDELPPDLRGRRGEEQPEAMEAYRYEMLNRSALCQRAVAHPRILETIEPLLGDDCHVIANTAWRNPPDPEGGARGGPWHTDAGPHVPRPPGVPWDERIPYPVFAIGAHVLLRDCPLACGPTGVIPGSHRSGQTPPWERLLDPDLAWQGARCEALTGDAGDVALFVSDAWHRRMPTGPDDRGRFFLQVHYGRRDIAQRLRPSDRAHQLSPEAVERAGDARARQLVGLHEPFFYDG